MGKIRSKTCEQGKDRRDHLLGASHRLLVRQHPRLRRLHLLLRLHRRKLFLLRGLPATILLALLGKNATQMPAMSWQLTRSLALAASCSRSRLTVGSSAISDGSSASATLVLLSTVAFSQSPSYSERTTAPTSYSSRPVIWDRSEKVPRGPSGRSFAATCSALTVLLEPSASHTIS